MSDSGRKMKADKWNAYRLGIGSLFTVRSSESGLRICNELPENQARLISAAPELLEALESCLGIIQTECEECYGCDADPCTQCRAKTAIAKAKGER